jgi:hypothetical protein
VARSLRYFGKSLISTDYDYQGLVLLPICNPMTMTVAVTPVVLAPGVGRTFVSLSPPAAVSRRLLSASQAYFNRERLESFDRAACQLVTCLVPDSLVDRNKPSGVVAHSCYQGAMFEKVCGLNLPG